MEIVIGAIIAILMTIFVENLRKPKLSLEITGPRDNEYNSRPANKARFLALNLRNSTLPKFARWMLRNAALQCHGTISFHDMDGQNIFGHAMQIRWSGSPEPVPSRLILGSKAYLIIDLRQLTAETVRDVYPGEPERLDVAVRFDDDSECYGWNNENYFSDPQWRNPKWELPAGRFLIKVIIVSAGEKCEKTFRLINDGPRRDFRIEEAMPNDHVKG